MSKKMNTVEGPFGSYDHGTPGAVLNHLVRGENVPLSVVETLQIGKEVIMKGNEQVGMFKWFDGISTPCVLWLVPSAHAYREPKVIIKNGISVPQFRPSLCVHGTPALEVSGEWATPALHWFLQGMLTNWTDDERYKLHQAAGAFFQGGHSDPNGKWFLMEFWKPEGVEAFIQYINEHYDPTDEMYKEFL